MCMYVSTVSKCTPLLPHIRFVTEPVETKVSGFIVDRRSVNEDGVLEEDIKCQLSCDSVSVDFV